MNYNLLSFRGIQKKRGLKPPLRLCLPMIPVLIQQYTKKWEGHNRMTIDLPTEFIRDYISLRNISSNCAKLAGRGLPGAQASAAADSQRKGRSSSLSFSSLVGIPTSTDS